MEAKQVKQLMEAYASVYTQSEEIITEAECECEEEESDEKEAPEMMGKKKGKKEKEKEEKGEKEEKEETQKEEVKLDEAGLPYGPVGKGFRKIPAGRQREAMMNRANTLRKKAMAASPEGDGGKGSSRGKMGEINAALLNPRLRPENVSYESDMFDIILEHLVAEGYADTNKAALAIMANMSEEWKQDIVEAKYGTKAGRKALAKKIRKGEEIGKSGPGTGFKAVEKAAEEGGATDPTAVAAAAMWKKHGGKKGKKG